MEEPRAVRWSVDRAAPPQAEAASGAAPGAPDAPAGPAPPRPEPNDPATGPDSQWFTHEMHVPSSVRLNQLFGGGSSAATSSGWSELDLEVERLAQVRAAAHMVWHGIHLPRTLREANKCHAHCPRLVVGPCAIAGRPVPLQRRHPKSAALGRALTWRCPAAS